MPPERHSTPAASPELPSFSDRLPDLVQALRLCARELAPVPPNRSFIPYVEDLHAQVHSLKGVTRILDCPRPMEDFIFSLNLELSRLLSGAQICRRHAELGAFLEQLASGLDREDAAAAADTAALGGTLREMGGLYTEDLPHEKRLEGIPPHLFYVNEQVSKKAREIALLQLNHCVLEDEARLDDIPLWRTQLAEALRSPEFGRGLVVNFLPFLSPEGSRSLKLWAWVAAASHSRASLKQRVKELLPRAKLTKL